jgi:uncharacterized protein YecE (DUF72 family)
MLVYYDFPRHEYLHKLADAVPDDFRFGVKVTDEVTIKKFPNLGSFRCEGRAAERTHP